MKLDSTSLPRLLSAEDTAGGALPVRDSLTGDPVPSNHNLSMESTPTFHGEVCTTLALSFLGKKRILGFVACDPGSAGALLRESAQLVTWTGACGAERKAIRSESGTSPLLAVPSEEKPVFRRDQLKINSSATAWKVNCCVLQSGGGGGGSDSFGSWSEGFKAKSGDRRVYCHISQTSPQASYLTLFLGSKVPFPHPTLGSKKEKRKKKVRLHCAR